MNILINGQLVIVNDNILLIQVLSQFGVRLLFVVVVNGDFVLCSQCDVKIFNEGDSIELLLLI